MSNSRPSSYAEARSTDIGDRVLLTEFPAVLVDELSGPTPGKLDRARAVLQNLAAVGMLVVTVERETRAVPGVWLVRKVEGRFGGTEAIPFNDPRGDVYEVRSSTGDGKSPSTYARLRTEEVLTEWIDRGAITPAVRGELAEAGVFGPVVRAWLGVTDEVAHVGDDGAEWIFRTDAVNRAVDADLLENGDSLLKNAAKLTWLKPHLRASDTLVNWTTLEPCLAERRAIGKATKQRAAKATQKAKNVKGRANLRSVPTANLRRP
jgi:hypothetical protein